MSRLSKPWARKRAIGALLAGFPLFLATLASADSTAVAPPGSVRLGGQAFGDFVYAVQGSVSDSTSFQFRRIYLTADYDLADRVGSRVVFEAENGTLTANGRMSPFVKLAYLQFREFLPAGSLFAGLVATPLWRTTETVWGYRSVEKTPLDFRGFGSSSDLGLSLEGSLGRGSPLGYALAVGNGNGQKPENDRSKKIYAALTIRPGRFVLEPLVDYEGGAKDQDRSTVKVLVGWLEERWAVGGEAWQRVNLGTGVPDPRGLSAFARSRIGRRMAAFARYDWFDANRRLRPLLPLSPSPDFDSHNVFVGFDYMPIPAVHVIPNLALEAFSGDPGGAHRESDLVLRLTLAYQYSE